MRWCIKFWRLGGKLWEYLLCVGQTGVPPTEEPIFVVQATLTGALLGAGVKASLAGWPQLWQGKLEENPVSTVLFSAVSWRPEILPLVLRLFAVCCMVRTCLCTCCTNGSCVSAGDGSGQAGWRAKPRLFTAHVEGWGEKPLGCGCSEYLIKNLMLNAVSVMIDLWCRKMTFWSKSEKLRCFSVMIDEWVLLESKS